MSSPRQIQFTAKNLRIRYGDSLAVSIDHLAVSGNVIALIGHNGSGKSTLMKAALELMVPSSGTLETHCASSGARLLPHRDMAFCPENGAVFMDIPVERYLELWCRIRLRDARYYRRDGSTLIEQMHLTTLLSKRGRELSKGQRRRVQIAVSFMLKPAVIFFDEPFDGLDVQQTKHLVDVMQSHAEQTAYVVSSHRMSVMQRLSDRVIVLNQGRLFACGGVAEACQTMAPDLSHPTLDEAMSHHLSQNMTQWLESGTSG